jgi:uncharacterized protein YgbK (DUF1537 family)
MAEILGIIADDLTGAGDTAVQFAGRGISSMVVFDPQRLPGAARIIAIETGSRGLTGAEAAEATGRAALHLRELGISSFYKKIDSMLRGHLAAELEAMMDALRIELALVAPAYPANGRITAGGYHLVRQVPVAESEAAKDPVAPVLESHLPTLLAKGCRRKVGYLELNTVVGGPAAIGEAIAGLRRSGVEIVACDATTESHLAAIASFLSKNPAVMGCGTAGLAKAMAQLRSGVTELRQPEAGAEKNQSPPVLAVVGSRSPLTAAQVFQCQDRMELVPLEAEAMFTAGRETAMERSVAAICRSLQCGRDTMVYLRASGPVVCVPGASGDLAAILGEITRRVLKQAIPVSGLILTGGDIAKAVSQRLEATALEVITEFAPAVPCSRFSDGLAPGLKVVTKGGACGGPDIIHDASRLLKSISAAP